MFKVEYHDNENPLKDSETIAYISQMHPIIKKNTLPYRVFLNAITFLGFYIKIMVLFNRKYIDKITNPIKKPQFLTIIKLTYTGIK